MCTVSFCDESLESMELKVEKPMILKVDNKDAKDLAHNWSVGDRAHHVDVKYHFLRELKENGSILVKSISQEGYSSNLFIKNLAMTSFKSLLIKSILVSRTCLEHLLLGLP